MSPSKSTQAAKTDQDQASAPATTLADVQPLPNVSKTSKTAPNLNNDAPSIQAAASHSRKSKRSSPTKAELELMLKQIQTEMELAATKHQQAEQQQLVQISDLQTQLEAQSQTVIDCQTQIDRLQSQLQEYQDYVEKIKTYLEQASKLKAELDRARQENAELLEVKQQLTTELAKLQRSPATHQRSAQQSIHQAGSRPRSSSSAMIVRRSPAPKKFKPGAQNKPKVTPKHKLDREILNRPVMPARTAQKINDANIGWVD
jgi:DNA repair exonuclease SbcCD ATPase subunit